MDDKVRIAFDADGVLFSDESEVVNKTEGLDAFQKQEDDKAAVPLPDGPFANFLRKLAAVKQATDADQEYAPVRIAVVTARNAPAEKRVIVTLRGWDVYVDAAYFLGGWDKTPVLRAFRPHVFFDDQDPNVARAAQGVPSARVPPNSDSPLAPPTPPDAAEPGTVIHLRKSAADLGTPTEDDAAAPGSGQPAGHDHDA